MSLAEVRADAKINRDRVSKIDLSKVTTVQDLAKWIKFELVEQVFPLVEASAEATEAEIAEVDTAVSALADLVDADDVEGLHPETAEQIMAVFALGKQLCVEFEPLVAKADEIKRKRLKGILKAFRKAIEVVSEIVNSLVIDEDEDGDAAQAGAAAAGEALEPGDQPGDPADEPMPEIGDDLDGLDQAGG